MKDYRSAAGRAPMVCGLGILLVLMAACSEPPPPEPPNIVLFLLDTVRGDAIELDPAKPDVTPTIRRLAVEGTWFDNAFAHTTWTKPSVATLFTSLFPTQHTVRSSTAGADGKYFSSVLPGEVETLAERLQQGGYSTVGIVNQTYLQKGRGFEQGFEEYFAYKHRRFKQLNNALDSWIANVPAERDKPFFLYMHYLDPHWPYHERVQSLRRALGPLEMDPKPPASGRRVRGWAADGVPDDQLRALHARYLHGVAATDRAVGEALDALERAGLLDNTAVVVTSDHGEGFLEHDEMLHSFAPYEEVHRVPLVMRLPERFEASVRRSSALVGLVDIKPTLLDIAGIGPGATDMGRSLVPLMRRQEVGSSRPVFSETGGIYSLRTDTHKLILHRGGQREFFDLEADPGEQAAIACDSLCEELDVQLAQLVAALMPFADQKGRQVEMDPADVERLRALGYLTD